MTTNQSGTLHSTDGSGSALDSRQSIATARAEWPLWEPSVGAGRTAALPGGSESHMVIVLMIQLMPNATDIQQKFSTSVYQALVK